MSLKELASRALFLLGALEENPSLCLFQVLEATRFPWLVSSIFKSSYIVISL